MSDKLKPTEELSTAEVPAAAPKYEMLPTGKPHVSFSEMRDWQDCSYRHKLKHVLKIDKFKPGPLMDFGTAVHASCENYLKTRVMKPEIATDMIRKTWETNKAFAGFEASTIPGFIKEA